MRVVVVLLLALCGSLAAASEKPVVVSSIKPLQLLVNSLAGDLVDSRLLVPATASPHHFQLRPSDRRMLQQAQAVFWVGPSLERFLSKPLANHPRVLRLLDEESAEEHTPGHDHGDIDPHIWLAYDEVRRMAMQVSEFLCRSLPAHCQALQNSRQRFLQEFAALDKQLAAQLSGDRRSYLLMHDAYGHFERRYGLQHFAVVARSPEQQPGLRHISRLREQLLAGQVQCLYREPQMPDGLTRSLLRDVDIAVLELDPLGVSLGEKDGFLALYRQLGEAFAACTGK